ncbi:MAG: hypothetical protein HKN09_00770 [Saprospiraceae bacterium]|nr:hypothetical protein [Saprospiraceae bacterium]
MRILLFILFISSSILLNAKPIITTDVLSYYQPNQTFKLLDQEVAFWENKLTIQYKNPSFHSKLAQAYSSQFATRGRIEDLKKAEHHFRESIKFSAEKRSGQLRNLAHNLISQHRFCEALAYLEEAYNLGGEIHLTELKLYDVYLELGEDALAFELLNKFEDRNPIQYKIRLAKWEDKNGRLDNAISSLESAIKDAERTKNIDMLKWLHSNIGDFYGHAGRLTDSRDAYVKALKLNNADWYSLKGLAWIAYSGEGNIGLTENIIRLLDDYCKSPSIDMLKLDVLQSEYRKDLETALLKSTYDIISKEAYGGMYNDFKIDYLLEKNEYEKALSIALEELEARATPQTYSQYAKVLHEKGDVDLAMDIFIKEVHGKTFEPKVFLEMLEVTQGYEPYYEEIKAELTGTRYELGPTDYKLVEEAIQRDALHSAN